MHKEFPELTISQMDVILSRCRKELNERSFIKQLGEWLVSSLEKIKDITTENILPLPKPVRIAVPLTVLAAAILLTFLLNPNNQNLNNMTDANQKSIEISQGEPQKITLQDPQEMESKASIDSMQTADDDSKTRLFQKLQESMLVTLSEDEKYVIFSWQPVDDVKSISIHLIEDDVEKLSIVNEDSTNIQKIAIDNLAP